MKKLMIALAVVAMSVAAQAASLSWSIGANSWTATKPGAGMLYYCVLTSDATSGALASAFASKDRTQIQTALNNATVKNTGNFAAAASTASGLLESDTSIKDGSSYTVTLIAFDGETIADADQFFVSTASAAGTGYVPPSTEYTKAQWTKNGTKVDGTWSDFVEPTPEPTSGLLLLLGMSALALRRRRA